MCELFNHDTFQGILGANGNTFVPVMDMNEHVSTLQKFLSWKYRISKL